MCQLASIDLEDLDRVQGGLYDGWNHGRKCRYQPGKPWDGLVSREGPNGTEYALSDGAVVRDLQHGPKSVMQGFRLTDVRPIPQGADLNAVCPPE